MYFEASEARKRAADATSSGSATRPSGTVLAKATRVTSMRPSLKADRMPAVLVSPGQIALARILSGASSSATDFMNWMTAPLLAE